MPIALLAHLIVLAIGLIYLFFHWRSVHHEITQTIQALTHANRILILVSVLFSLLFVYQSSLGPFNYDTGLYHSQAIQWIEKYRIVPGLGNLHSRFAFNSLWFLPSALFSFTFWLGQPIHALNGLMLLMAIIFALGHINTLIVGAINPSSTFQSLLIFPLAYLGYDSDRFATDVASPSTDLPATVLVFVVTTLILHYQNSKLPKVKISAESDRKEQDVNTAILAIMITILAVFAVFIKLSVIPILLFLPYLIVDQFRKNGIVIAALILGITLFIATPHLIRNVILSGYLIYPLPQLDLFNWDWKIPLQTVVAESMGVRNWAKMPPGSSPEAVLSSTGWSWFPAWFNYFKSQPIAQCLGLGIAGFSLSNLLRFRQFNWTKFSVIYAVIAIGLIFWFFSAPDPRFGYGLLISFAIMLTLPLLTEALHPLSQRPQMLQLILSVYVVASFVLSMAHFKFYSEDINLFWRSAMGYPSVPTQSVTFDRQTIYIPLKGDQCWNSAFPCTPQIPTNLRLRGRSLQDGFTRLRSAT